MCRSTADIQCAVAEIRRGKYRKKIEDRKKNTGRKYNGLSYSIGRPQLMLLCILLNRPYGHNTFSINVVLLWPPFMADVDIICLPMWFVSSFFDSPNLSGRSVDNYLPY